MATCFGGHIIRKTPELLIDERKIDPCLGFFRLQYGGHGKEPFPGEVQR